MSLKEQLEYISDSSLYRHHLSNYYQFYDPDSFAFNEYVDNQMNAHSWNWDTLHGILTDLYEVVSYSEFVYRDMEQDDWYQWHDLDKNDLTNIIEEFEYCKEYDELFAEKISFDGLEELIA